MAQAKELQELYAQTKELIDQTKELQTLNDVIGHAKRVLYGVKEVDSEINSIWDRIKGINPDNLPNEEVTLNEDLYGSIDEETGLITRPDDHNVFKGAKQVDAAIAKVTGAEAQKLREKRMRLEGEIEDLASLLDNAATDQEVQKYTGLLIAHQAQIMSVMAEELKLSQEQMAEFHRLQNQDRKEEIAARESGNHTMKNYRLTKQGKLDEAEKIREHMKDLILLKD